MQPFPRLRSPGSRSGKSDNPERQWRRPYLVALVVMGALLASTIAASPVAAASATVLSLGPNRVVGGTSINSITGQTSIDAGYFNGSVDGTPTVFYCVDLTHSVDHTNANAYVDDGSTNSLPNGSKVTYILNHYFPFAAGPGQLANTSEEAASVQLAIWVFTNGLDLSTVTASSPAVATILQTRAAAIVADANSSGSSGTGTVYVHATSPDSFQKIGTPGSPPAPTPTPGLTSPPTATPPPEPTAPSYPPTPCELLGTCPTPTPELTPPPTLIPTPTPELTPTPTPKPTSTGGVLPATGVPSQPPLPQTTTDVPPTGTPGGTLPMALLVLGFVTGGLVLLSPLPRRIRR